MPKVDGSRFKVETYLHILKPATGREIEPKRSDKQFRTPRKIIKIDDAPSLTYFYSTNEEYKVNGKMRNTFRKGEGVANNLLEQDFIPRIMKL